MAKTCDNCYRYKAVVPDAGVCSIFGKGKAVNGKDSCRNWIDGSRKYVRIADLVKGAIVFKGGE